MSLHDTVMGAMLDIEDDVGRAGVNAPEKKVDPAIEAILVRMEVYNFFHWTSPGGDGAKFWDKSQQLIAAPLTVEQLKSEFVKLVKEEKGHDIAWNKWRIEGAIQHPSQLPGWDDATKKMAERGSK